MNIPQAILQQWNRQWDLLSLDESGPYDQYIAQRAVEWERSNREPLTPDECRQVVELLDEAGHPGTDFKPECPLCAVRRKLAHGIGEQG